MSSIVKSLRFERTSFLKRFALDDGTTPAGISNNVRNYSGDLVSIDMPRLSDVVIVAGPNGSGKSRTLGLLRHIVGVARASWPNLSSIPEGTEDGSFLRCIDLETDLRPVWVNIAPVAPTIKQVAAATHGDFEAASKRLEQSFGQFEENNELAAVMAKRCFDENWDATHQHSTLDQGRKKTLMKRWADWCTLVQSLLRKEMRGDSLRQVYIGNHSIDDAIRYFSEGERRLFALSATLACANTANQRRVIICDEPESHLHPEAAVEVLTKIRDGLPEDQLWIATHSLPIIAALGWENVWTATNGKVSFSGRNTERILDGLLGGHDNQSRLRALIDEPSKAALAKFAADALSEPRMAATSSTDPQYSSLAQATSASTPAKVLDWGAGSGRLAYWISGQPDHVRDQFDYFALETHDSSGTECLRNLVRIHDDAKNRLFRSVNALRTSNQFGKFDFVVLANVLHEIPIIEWQQTFKDICAALNASGRLLILEDIQMPVGELPNREGFLLLTASACRLLFKDASNQITELLSKDARYSDRLKCYSVPRQCVDLVDVSSIRNAITAIKDHSLYEVARLRSAAQTDYKSGAAHGLNLCLFANANLALDRI
jgi:ABC-type lipoprotein export system ATPase subunit